MAWHQPLRVNCTVFEVWGSGSHSGFVCPERVRALSFWQGRRAVWRRDKLSPFYLCVLACEWFLFLRKGEGGDRVNTSRVSLAHSALSPSS